MDYSRLAGETTVAPAPIGVASRVSDLQKAVSELESLAYQVKGALGITSPGQEGGKIPNEPSTLADVLTSLRVKITRASADLQDVITHLNS